MTDFTPTVTLSLREYEELTQQRNSYLEQLTAQNKKVATLEAENKSLRESCQCYNELAEENDKLIKLVERLQFTSRNDQGLD